MHKVSLYEPVLSMRSLFVIILLHIFSIAVADDPTIPQTIEFNRDVRPILAENCFYCHGPDAQHRQGDLRLDQRESAIDSGAIKPGNSSASSLISRIVTEDADERMPPLESKKNLSRRQLEILQRWVEQGANYQRHWAFELPRKADPPLAAGAVHPIDRFVQSKLSDAGLTPSPLASNETLVRRVSLDLVGLPPTVAEVDEFLAACEHDPAAAYAGLVERLLDSPHYGERWGRWWLDQARYADSNGYSIDAPRQIWAFRDWVIQAFNEDLPFDEFTLQQIAGDLLPDATDAQKIATGFHRNTQINQEGGIDREQFRVDSVFDRVATTGTVWLGLTIGCAQCHDHKFDPITQREYYQLFAFLNNQDEPTMRVYPPGVDGATWVKELRQSEMEIEQHLSQHGEELVAWETELNDDTKKKLSASIRKLLEIQPKDRSAMQRRSIYAAGPGVQDAHFRQLSKRHGELELRINNCPTTMVLSELPKPRKTTIFIKGDFTRPADEVSPGAPATLHPMKSTTPNLNRIDLAKWLTSRDSPLTARVFVNRVWQQYFGVGIVETENDFGTQGSLPSHPELLDWLAVRFMEGGWRIKDLHRLIVMSHTYRQSSVERSQIQKKDPHNTLLARQRRLRLDAEIVRDVALTASELLCKKTGGPPVFPPIPEGVMNVGQVKRAWELSQGEDRYRRGLYTFVFRATPPPALNVFDAPDGYFSCTRRIRSNTPLQALTLLNDTTSIEFGSALERFILADGVEHAFRRCTSRYPDADELKVLSKLDARSAARVLLNLDETITRE